MPEPRYCCCLCCIHSTGCVEGQEGGIGEGPHVTAKSEGEESAPTRGQEAAGGPGGAGLTRTSSCRAAKQLRPSSPLGNPGRAGRGGGWDGKSPLGHFQARGSNRRRGPRGSRRCSRAAAASPASELGGFVPSPVFRRKGGRSTRAAPARPAPTRGRLRPGKTVPAAVKTRSSSCKGRGWVAPGRGGW